MGLSTAVLRLNRQISSEALSVLYGENNFGFYNCMRGGLPPSIQICTSLSANNLLWLRRLRLVHRWDTKGPLRCLPGKTEPFSFLALRPDFWQPILSQLLELEIILFVDCHHHGDNTVAENAVAKHRASNPNAAAEIRAAMTLCESQFPPSLKVSRLVRCNLEFVCTQGMFAYLKWHKKATPNTFNDYILHQRIVAGPFWELLEIWRHQSLCGGSTAKSRFFQVVR
jgi:hypothetical protein